MRVGFTMAARLSRCHNGLVGLRSAFTMAEILLSLTIIGVVAAITLPSLTGNINERTWNTQRKALYARMSQAIALMPALNGYGDDADNAAETFVTAGLSKVLKINNICDSDHLSDCGIADKITRFDGNVIMDFTTEKNTLLKFNDIFTSSDTKAAAFETVNGESIVVYYNPYCVQENSQLSITRPFMCANFVYDLNGSKGPNTVGKDIGFISVLYPSDSEVVAPLPANKLLFDRQLKHAGAACREAFGNYRMPTLAEASAIFYNKELLGGFHLGEHHNRIPTSTRGVGGKFYIVDSYYDWRSLFEPDAYISLRCVQR